LDQVERDPRLLGDVAQRQDDAGHVLGLRHRPVELEDVRNLDRRRMLAALQFRALRDHLGLLVRDLLLQLERLCAERRDHEQIAAGGDPDEQHHDNSELDAHVERRDLLLHDDEPPMRTLPCSVNVSMPIGHVLDPPELAPELDDESDDSELASVMSDRSGTSSSRERNRATESCEYVQPSTMNPPGAPPATRSIRS